jgi:hypothetical protein
MPIAWFITPYLQAFSGVRHRGVTTMTSPGETDTTDSGERTRLTLERIPHSSSMAASITSMVRNLMKEGLPRTLRISARPSTAWTLRGDSRLPSSTQR